MKASFKAIMIVVFLLYYETGIQAQTVEDIDGNVYNTVSIGRQVWMVENLKTTKYNDNTAIPYISYDTAWVALTTDAYCNYDNNPLNSDTHGRLYNWYAVASTNSKNVCPTGWHVPTQVDWGILITNAGGLGAVAGKLKEKGTIHWLKPNKGATNETGFTGLPGGFRGSGEFSGVGLLGLWWMPEECYSTHAWNFIILNYKKDAILSCARKDGGFSVRCIKD